MTTLFTGLGWAVEKQIITAGGNQGSPTFLSATSLDSNTVRLTFNRKLQLEYRPSGPFRAKTLDIPSFRITSIMSGLPLQVVRVIWIDYFTLDLYTENQQNISYNVTCLADGVRDFWGNGITEQTLPFEGQQRADYPTPSQTNSFTSGNPGMQVNAPGEIYPDMDPPYLNNVVPPNLATDVSASADITFDVVDEDKGVALSTVRIYVNSVLAYNGSTDTFFAPFNNVGSSRSSASPNGYHFVLHQTTPRASYSIIAVGVYARDLAPLPNVLDTTYAFRTLDYEMPYLYLPQVVPAAGDTDVSRSSTVALEVHDDGSGINPVGVQLYVAGVLAWQTRASQPGFSVIESAVTHGYRYVITKTTPFDTWQTVAVRVVAPDNAVAPNTLDTTYSFRTLDDVAPALENCNPFDGAGGISRFHPVIFDLIDAGAGVDTAATTVTIGDVLAWSGDAPRPGFTGSRTTVLNGYHYSITKSGALPLGSIAVAVHARDQATTPNVLDITYHFTTVSTVAPSVYNYAPTGTSTVHPRITFSTADDIEVVLSTLQVSIGGLTVIQNGVILPGWAGPESAITANTNNGYDVVIDPEQDFAYDTSYDVIVSVQNDGGLSAVATWTFYTGADPTCFIGPLNVFEQSLLVPYDYAGSKLYYVEQLRRYLLEVVTNVPDPIKAIRQVFLRAHMCDLGPVLRGIVPTPTTFEKAVKLCYKRTAIEIDADLRRKPGLLKAALSELKGLGLPVEHSQLLWSYLRTDQPNDLVPLACLIVCMAKALEKNELS